FAPLWQELSSMLSIENPLLLIFEWIVVGLIGVAGNILLLYLAMAIGQLANAHKFLASFGAFIALQCAMGAITAILTGIIAILPIQPLLAWLEQQGPIVILHLGTLVAALTAIVSGAVYYFFTHWLLKRKLNLT
ncbi:MAG: hypothetical protein FWG43_05700, partial [Clostridiales bacterium]|nr:hypothetical protein [Clostridiales bacterium]